MVIYKRNIAPFGARKQAMIYFDNAATSWPKPLEVARAMAGAIEQFGNAARGAHGPAMAAARQVEKTRLQVASLFNCQDPARVIFTKSATEALNLALASIDGHIISGEAEHNSLLRPIFRKGNFSLAPLDDQGRYDIQDIKAALRPETRALALAHASNVTGNPAPIEELGRLCRDQGLIFILDAAQTAGLAAIDMEALGLDALCFSGHKSLYGLPGTGGICLSPRFSPEPLIVGGSGHHSFDPRQPREYPDRLEAGTINSHGLAALSAGLDYLTSLGPGKALAEAGRLARKFHEGAQGIEGLIFYGDYAAAGRMPLVTLNIAGRPSEEAAAELWDEYGLAVRAGVHCAPLLHRRFKTEAQGALRFSFSHFNRDAELEIALDALKNLVARR